MIANPFYNDVKAGLFVSCKSVDYDSKDTITERICSAIAEQLITDANQLQDDSWIKAVGSKIPYQMDSSHIDDNVQFSRKILAIDVAKQCISSVFQMNSDYDLVSGIEAWLSDTINIDELNCFSVSFTRKMDIQLSLAFVKGILGGSLHIIRNETVVPYSDQHIKQQIDNLFKNFQALNDKPYSIAIA